MWKFLLRRDWSTQGHASAILLAGVGSRRGVEIGIFNFFVPKNWQGACAALYDKLDLLRSRFHEEMLLNANFGVAFRFLQPRSWFFCNVRLLFPFCLWNCAFAVIECPKECVWRVLHMNGHISLLKYIARGYIVFVHVWFFFMLFIL